MNKNKLRVALVGFGVAARYFHLPFLLASSNYSVETVLSSKESKVREALPSVSVVRELDQLLSTKPDLVIITAPNSQHYSIAKSVIAAGCNLVIEKPFVTSVAHGEELISLAQRKGVLMSVYHNRRWDSDFITLQKIIADNKIGNPSLFISRFDRYRPIVKSGVWREQDAGGGLLYDIGSHLIDQALLLFGQPSSIQAQVLIQREGGILNDYFDITLAFGKLRARLQSSCFVHGQFPRFEIHGPSGSYRKYGLEPQEGQARAGHLANIANWGVEPENMYGILSQRVDSEVKETLISSERGNYGEFYSILHRSITTGVALPVNPEQALNVIRIIQKIQNHESVTA